tara:strand:- start:639 stop:818 length:180 start_codon:yes stop_codon:yes gene_type:complete
MAGIEFSHNRGDIIEVANNDEAKRYIEVGIAEPVEETKIETATKKTPEKKTAVKEKSKD